MKVSKLLAVAALACAAALFVSPSAFAATADPVAGPILGYEDVAYPAVCELGAINADAIMASAMAECSTTSALTTPADSFVLATLHAPASIYDLPLDFRIDPGRMAGAVT